jgi:hypothetical protein
MYAVPAAPPDAKEGQRMFTGSSAGRTRTAVLGSDLKELEHDAGRHLRQVHGGALPPRDQEGNRDLACS